MKADIYGLVDISPIFSDVDFDFYSIFSINALLVLIQSLTQLHSVDRYP